MIVQRLNARGIERLKPNLDDILRYSLNPFERKLCPFKKHKFNDFRRKCLNENGIIETLEDYANYHNAISFRHSA
jgi:hypothetical protein